MERLKGRTAFITGGAQGIGLGIARALAREGVQLALVDIDPAALGRARSELSAHTPTEAFALDVGERARFAEVADEVERRLGPVSLLFNNAGVTGEGPASALTYETWDWILGVNLHGVVNGVQTFLPRMLDRGGDAHIVNTSSGAGLVMAGAGVVYTTSKFAVVGLSEALRHGLRRHGIGVSVLCPGYVDTGIVDNSAAWNPAPRVVSGGAAAGRARAKTSLSGGTPIDDVGDMVVAAVISDELYIYTDDMIAGFLERRSKALLDALAPFTTSPADSSSPKPE